MNINAKTIVFIRSIAAALALSLLLLAAGCAPRVAVNADNDNADVDTSGFAAEQPPEPVIREIVGGAGRIGIIDPEMLLYDVSVGGILELRDDWSRAASRMSAKSAAITLKRFGYSPRVLPDPGNISDFFWLKSRMRYHGTAFRSDFFAVKRHAFGIDDTLTYSLGPIEDLCDRYGVDAFMYIYGYGENFSEELRGFLNDEGVDRPERTFVSVILAERDGRVSWYKHIVRPYHGDMRRESQALRIMEALFE